MKLNKEALNAYLQSNSSWKYIGHGSFNHVFVSKESFSIEGSDYHGRWVLKKPIPWLNGKPRAINEASRAVRKAQLINPKYPALQFEDYLLTAYLGERLASDLQVAEQMILKYKETKNFVYDAYGKANCLFHDGEALIVDYDEAYERGSPVSESFLSLGSEAMKQRRYHYFVSYYIEKPVSVAVAQGMWFLFKQSSAQEPIENRYLNLVFLQVLGVFIVSGITPGKQNVNEIYATIENKPSFIEAALALIPKATEALKHELLLHCLCQAEAASESTFAPIRDQIISHSSVINRNGMYYGFNYLYLAAAFNHAWLIDTLIATGAVIDTQSRTYRQTATDIACALRNKEAFEALISHKPTPPALSQRKFHWLHFAASRGLIEAFKYIKGKLTHPGSYPRTVFNGQACYTEQDIFCTLDDRERTVLLIAAGYCQKDMLSFLLANGAEPYINILISAKAWGINSPTNKVSLLDIVIGNKKNKEIIRILHNAGAKLAHYPPEDLESFLAEEEPSEPVAPRP